jgi:general secretion pathway protein G
VKRSVAVAAAIAIVAACGEPKPTRSDVMRQNLSEIRKAIRDFRADKHRPPKTLNDLVQAKYLHAMPTDPVTGAADWRVVMEQSVHVDDFSGAPASPPAIGIVDVHSAASGTDSNGKPWSEY